MDKISRLLEKLVEHAHPEGGWGYAPEQAASLEPTCLGLLALSLEPERHAEARQKARHFLHSCAMDDGSYRLSNGRDEALWPTAVVLFTQCVLAYPAETLARTARRLLGLRGRVPPTEAGEIQDIDIKLVGWPWGENNFSWVEPTAWACLALRRAAQGSHERVCEGMRLLLDRAMDEGGVNYGNRRVLGRLLEPIPGPTALMLLAVQGQDQQGQDHPRVAAAVQYLLTQIEADDIDHLCWAKIALEIYRDQPGVETALPRLDERIENAQQARQALNWVRPALVRLALTALALGASRKNVFRLSTACGLAAAPAIAASTGRKPGWTQRLGAWFRGLAVKGVGSLRPPPATSAVHIVHAVDYDADLTSVLQSQYQHFRDQMPLAGKRVVLKPNLVEYHRDKVINTNPRVVAAAIELCRREGATEVIVAEGPGHWRNVEYLVKESGLGDVLQQLNVPFVDINHDEPVKLPNLGRLTGLEYLFMSRTIVTADVLISMPKLKTHHWAGATLSLKNLFGTLPGICYGWPKNELHWRGIDNSIVDIALTRTPELAIVDGIVGMEGDGPLNGTAKPMGVLVMGCDLVAVDATCCRLMQIDPERIGYLLLGHAKKLGRLKAADIPQLGESIESLAQPFETVPHLSQIRIRQTA